MPTNTPQDKDRDAQLERDRQPQTGAESAAAQDPGDPRNQAKDAGANPDAGRHSDTKQQSSRKNPKSTQPRGISHPARGTQRPE